MTLVAKCRRHRAPAVLVPDSIGEWMERNVPDAAGELVKVVLEADGLPTGTYWIAPHSCDADTTQAAGLAESQARIAVLEDKLARTSQRRYLERKRGNAYQLVARAAFAMRKKVGRAAITQDLNYQLDRVEAYWNRKRAERATVPAAKVGT